MGGGGGGVTSALHIALCEIWNILSRFKHFQTYRKIIGGMGILQVKKNLFAILNDDLEVAFGQLFIEGLLKM